MSDTMVLVKTTFDYSDEFDVYGFAVMPAAMYDKSLLDLNAYMKEQGSWERWFGTNESVCIRPFADYEYGVTVTELTSDEYLTLKKLFGAGRSGDVWFGTLSFLRNNKSG